MKLLVMRLTDMHRVHPNQDNSRVCSKCQQPVGIYPSGQKIIAQYPGDVELVCSVCDEKEKGTKVQILAPGALQEPFESIDNPKRKQ